MGFEQEDIDLFAVVWCSSNATTYTAYIDGMLGIIYGWVIRFTGSSLIGIGVYVILYLLTSRPLVGP